MKRLLAIAALLLASSAAQAQYSFEYGGRTIHIDPDRGTVSIPGVYDNTGKKSKRTQDNVKSRPSREEAKPDPQSAPAPPDTAAAPSSAPAATQPDPAPATAT